MLRDWRSVRGKSQLDLALDAGTSQRHVSFIESGRSTPGREKLLAIAEALDVPFRERNALLVAAGYAPVYPEDGWNEPQMRSITAAVGRMLRQQEPFPAVLMDRYWNVVAANDAAPKFFGKFVDLAARAGPRNILHLMFDPAGMRPFVRDWKRAEKALLGRVRREAVGHFADERTRELVDALMAYPGVAAEGRPETGGESLPMIPLSFERDGLVLNYFSMISTVGTPTTVTAQELRLECMFPADEATERHHLALME
ncbi:helix-turn-helix domain-containing protein [Aureimonas leprariae]|uniref:Helix-turn-helix transcriptional regulator n=1 Tax=Plantimonas leprariae TaxID=2615207 RepID=A0A7V7TZ26_9HYPH|nr:helix-turn-helix transcriptional regulator [Aureimonas leprariae]KAB0678563.1 helix-turn-helix transcriptional regulator [Aureimonas leprariae]